MSSCPHSFVVPPPRRAQSFAGESGFDARCFRQERKRREVAALREISECRPLLYYGCETLLGTTSVWG
jgi:hypothetical protein